MRQMLQSEMRSAQDVKWYRRLKVIDLSGQGTAVPELARMFDLKPATIRSYIHAFNTHGLDGLRPGNGQGRALALDWTAEQWLDVLAQSPGHLALLDTAPPILRRQWKRLLVSIAITLKWFTCRLRARISTSSSGSGDSCVTR